MKIAKNNPNWIFRIYNRKNKTVEELRIMNRLEREADREAGSYVDNQHNGKDWTLTKVDKDTDMKMFNNLPEL